MTEDELREIRRIWPSTSEDRLPEIHEETTGIKFSAKKLNDSQPFGKETMRILRDAAEGNQIQFKLIRELLQMQRSYRTSGRRAKIFDRLEAAFER